MSLTSIVLADSQFLIRLGLKNLIRNLSGFNVITEVANEFELVSFFKKEKADLVILDYNQSGSFGIETIRKINKIAPKTNFLIISADNIKTNIYEVLELGVNSFLTKQCEEDEILNAIKATAKGEKFFCNNVLNYILEKSFSIEEEGDCSPTPLSFREIQVVKLIAEGKIAKEIADDLSLSTHTVYTHRKNIMRKLELNSTSELVIYAINHGIIEPDLANT
jgi:DNA-binding NarL/FixJ family response regulator